MRGGSASGKPGDGAAQQAGAPAPALARPPPSQPSRPRPAARSPALLATQQQYLPNPTRAVAPAHAKFTQKGKQLFLTALVGESVFDDSSTWIDGDQARPNVAYVLSNGSRVAFGGVTSDADGGVTSDAAFVVEFEEPSGANPLVEMLMQGAAAGASPEVRKALNSSE